MPEMVRLGDCHKETCVNSKCGSYFYIVYTLHTDTDNGVLEKLAFAYMIIMLEKLCIEAVSSNSLRYGSRVCTIKPKLLLGNKEPLYLTLRKEQQDMLISVMDWIPKTYWKL